MKQNENTRKNALLIVSELTNRFPDLDFRFNITNNNDKMRYKISNFPNKIHEIDLTDVGDTTVLNTILDVKADCGIFDA